MSNECRGYCFEQIGNGLGSGESEYVKQKGSRCKCELIPCPKCGDKYPLALLDCCEGYCQECAVKISSVFGYVKEKLNIKDSKGDLQKFADLMAEFYH